MLINIDSFKFKFLIETAFQDGLCTLCDYIDNQGFPINQFKPKSLEVAGDWYNFSYALHIICGRGIVYLGFEHLSSGILDVYYDNPVHNESHLGLEFQRKVQFSKFNYSESYFSKLEGSVSVKELLMVGLFLGADQLKLIASFEQLEVLRLLDCVLDADIESSGIAKLKNLREFEVPMYKIGVKEVTDLLNSNWFDRFEADFSSMSTKEYLFATSNINHPMVHSIPRFFNDS